MEAKVKVLFDPALVVVPEEMTRWKVTDQQVEEQLERIGRLNAREVSADMAAAGDCVVCSCEAGQLEGRTVLLYPGLCVPGAEAAEQAALGRKVGETFEAELNGTLTLTVQKVIHRMFRGVDDEAVQALGIDGVTTVEAYRTWYQKDAGEKNREQALKYIKFYILDTVAAKSEIEVNQAELDAWARPQVEQAYESMQVPGMPLENRDEMMAMLKEQCIQGFRRDQVSRALCGAQGFVYTPDMFEAQVAEMAAQMPGMEEMLEEYRTMFVNDAYMMKTMELLDAQARGCLEV